MGARFEITYREIEKVVDCKDLNNQVENLMIFLKMSDVLKSKLSERSMFNHAFVWAWDLLNNGDINETTNFFDGISDEVYQEIESQLDSIVKSLESVLIKFKTKTDISIYWDYDYDNDKVVFEMNWNDIVQFTPKVSVLDNMGVDFDLISYDDN